MREQEESRDLLYAIRALEIMMSSGVGLEAAILSIAGGGYGIISEDFQKMIKQQKKGKKSVSYTHLTLPAKRIV